MAKIEQGATPLGSQDRAYWIKTLDKIARLVLTALAQRRLREMMPIESLGGDNDRADRALCTHLEAFARVLVGIAPWLELEGLTGDEAVLQTEYRELALKAIDAATNPASPDCMNFGAQRPGPEEYGLIQALVDAAFFAQALLRAPVQLWSKLPAPVQANLTQCLKSSRNTAPGFNNWLLFSAIVEAALAAHGEDWDAMRVDYAIRQHDAWYVGDGAYCDGPEFHWDYYNSFVIQPMILDVLRETDPVETGQFRLTYSAALGRARRNAAVLERLISPEGAIPPIGRSLAYRMGALHLLGQIALLGELAPEIEPAQVRCAMTTVMRRLMEAPGTFDDAGWLRIGFFGSQPLIGEAYISTGSLYLCSTGLLPLGLPPSDPFWSGTPRPWTSQRVYGGESVAADHALKS